MFLAFLGPRIRIPIFWAPGSRSLFLGLPDPDPHFLCSRIQIPTFGPQDPNFFGPRILISHFLGPRIRMPIFFGPTDLDLPSLMPTDPDPHFWPPDPYFLGSRIQIPISLAPESGLKDKMCISTWQH